MLSTNGGLHQRLELLSLRAAISKYRDLQGDCRLPEYADTNRLDVLMIRVHCLDVPPPPSNFESLNTSVEEVSRVKVVDPRKLCDSIKDEV